jgi:hypothetical protein
MNSKSFLTILFITLCTSALAQDTLPKFTVRNVGKERYVISWVNNYEHVNQISIQRSFDSLKNFKTILSVADPNSRQNGFVDAQATNDHMFYRLFIVLSGGSFYFTGVKKPAMDTAQIRTDATANVKQPAINNPEQNSDNKDLSTKGNPSEVKKDAFVPSFYVYTNKRDGNVSLNLPNADEKKYSIRFFEDDGTPLFEIKNIKETSLIVDKSNFLHAGWFRFELYEGDKLKEKHKFYLAKEF